MADVKELNINNTTYDIKDAIARSGLANKQDTLVSGTNIKTINGNPILGSGDLTITAGATRNIGEIVASTIPLTDAGLHLLDGTLLQYGTYKAFIDYIAGLVTDYPDLFVTEADWQTSVTTYGVCGKFVYDAINDTVRLPKITGIIEGTTDVTALGDLIQAGLPNITGTFGADTGSLESGAIYRNPNSNTGYAFDNPSTVYTGNIFDASRSSSIYGNSTTVQPQAIKCYYYIVVATSTKTDIQVDIDEIATDLNGKCDTDGTNAIFPHVVESYINGNSGYIIYSPDENGNKRCIQWGTLTGTLVYGLVTVTLLKPIKLPYVVTANIDWAPAASAWYTSTFNPQEKTVTDVACPPINKTNTTFQIQGNSDRTWRIDGYLYEE